MDFDYLKILVTVVLAVTGWLIGHWYTAKRDTANKRRELVVSYLVTAYRVLANDISNREPTQKSNRALEDVLSDIQLFGSEEQVTLARQLATDVASGKGFDLNPLINSLRDDLRCELNLSPVTGNTVWFRWSE